MKTKIYNSFDELYKDAKGLHQITAQELLNGQTKLFDRWGVVSLSDELKQILIEAIADKVKGREQTRSRVVRCLTVERPQHWALSRMVIESYSNKARLVYIAGQDQVSEMADLRKYLSR